MKLFQLIACGLLVIVSPSLLAQTAILHPKVVIVSYFEIGSDTGDRPGELQFWVERDRLDRTVEVPGMSRPVRASHDGSEIAVAVGPGNINPAVNLMALGADPRFDLRDAHWLLNGIAGISPQDGTVGAAVWTDFVVNGDLAKEIDPREIPSTWTDGFMSLDGDSPHDPKGGAGWEDDVRRWNGSEARANRRGNVIRLNLALLQWAYGLTKNMTLPENEAMRKLRMSYRGFPGTMHAPRVQVGANLATEIFWHGRYMDAWAHRWIGFETDGVGHLATTSMNDTGALLALQALARQGKTDWNNVLLLRTASNFDMPSSGTTAAQSLARERHGSYTGYTPALEAAYRTGHTVVAEWLK